MKNGVLKRLLLVNEVIIRQKHKDIELKVEKSRQESRKIRDSKKKVTNNPIFHKENKGEEPTSIRTVCFF